MPCQKSMFFKAEKYVYFLAAMAFKITTTHGVFSLRPCSNESV